MGYSIYCDLMPGAIQAVDAEPQKFPILHAFFKPEYRRKIVNNLAWAWTKPRGNAEHEKAFLLELKAMHDLSLLVEISADAVIDEKPLKNKVPDACLLPYIREQV